MLGHLNFLNIVCCRWTDAGIRGSLDCQATLLVYRRDEGKRVYLALHEANRLGSVTCPFAKRRWEFLENDLTNEGVSLSFPSLPSYHDIRQTAICSFDAVVPLCITEGKGSTGMVGEVLEETSQMADHGPRSLRPSYQAWSDLSGVGNGLEGDSLQLGACS